MKRLLKIIVVAILSRQIRLLRKKHVVKVIGVVGGIGKTSTKVAIAKLLGTTLRVRYQEGNYNHLVSVPLIFFGHEIPSLGNPLAWIKLFLNNAEQINGTYPYDVVIVELGTNGPGQIAAFHKYLDLDYTVVTALVPEHMQHFKDMQAVADEELTVAQFSDKLMYNADLVPEVYQTPLQNALSYGNKQPADYRLAHVVHQGGSFKGDIMRHGHKFLRFEQEILSEVQLYSLLAAVAIGDEFGLTPDQIRRGMAAVEPVAGRLRPLRGINESLIIDDTYNAVPDAVKASLQVLYGMEAPQKIAILGSMNELGSISPDAHKEIGELCDPAQLAIVATIGQDANDYLAPAAVANGCKVKTFDTPYAAGEYVKSRVKHGAIIFAKGSQNKVFAEEAVKLLLADPKDVAKLDRQSSYWLERKRKSFE